MSETAPGALRRAFARLVTPREQIDADELQQECLDTGGTPIASVPDRVRATLSGTVRTVTLQPVGGVLSLEAELYDGTGAVSLVWLGRRRIVGIEPGCGITATGVVALQGGRRVMFNPRYELRPAGRE